VSQCGRVLLVMVVGVGLGGGDGVDGGVDGGEMVGWRCLYIGDGVDALHKHNTPMLGLKPLTAAYRAVAQRPRGSTGCCRWPERQRKDACWWQGAVQGTVLTQCLSPKSVTMTS
jgi:hypothetical protein